MKMEDTEDTASECTRCILNAERILGAKGMVVTHTVSVTDRDSNKLMTELDVLPNNLCIILIVLVLMLRMFDRSFCESICSYLVHKWHRTCSSTTRVANRCIARIHINY